MLKKDVDESCEDGWGVSYTLSICTKCDTNPFQMSFYLRVALYDEIGNSQWYDSDVQCITHEKNTLVISHSPCDVHEEDDKYRIIDDETSRISIYIDDVKYEKL